MKVGDSITVTKKQWNYLRQRFYKYNYKMSYTWDKENKTVTCKREPDEG